MSRSWDMGSALGLPPRWQRLWIQLKRSPKRRDTRFDLPDGLLNPLAQTGIAAVNMDTAAIHSDERAIALPRKNSNIDCILFCFNEKRHILRSFDLLNCRLVELH